MFNFNPYAIFAGLQQRPNQGNQAQQQNPNIIDNIANFINNQFMNPAQQRQQQNQQQNQNEQEPRPRFFRQGPKKQEPQQKKQTSANKQAYSENTGMYWKIKGNECFKQGNYEGALKMYDKAINLNNTESVFFSNRSRCLKKLNKLEQALEDAQIAVQLDVDNIKAHLICGQILASIAKQKRDFRKAQSALKRLTKALTLCSNQHKQQYEKQLAVYIYRIKKLIWYMRFQEIKNQRIKSINQYKKYVDSDQKLSAQKKKQKVDSFVNSINEQVRFEIPDYLTCKITLDLMEDPVTTESGQTYERSAIEQHIKKNGKTDPFTRNPINGKLYPSIAIKKGIQEFLAKNPWAYEYCEGQSIKEIVF